MECSEIELNIIGYLDENLTHDERLEFEKHLLGCDDCMESLKETRALFGAFGKVAEATPSPQLRTRFLQELDEEKEVQGATLASVTEKAFPWKTAFQIAASVLLLIGGYAVGSFRESAKNNTQIVQLQDQTSALKQDMMLAMLENRSVSKRIKAVSYTEDMTSPDTEVLEALVERLHYDGNINVRLAAAEGLSKYATNEIVKQAFIKSLTTEKNPNIQIAVIQFLVEIQDERARAPMQQLLEHSDTPDYVKEQVNAGLKQII